jgi:hypothetical protein
MRKITQQMMYDWIEGLMLSDTVGDAMDICMEMQATICDPWPTCKHCEGDLLPSEFDLGICCSLCDEDE